jgi:hypothetical protein
MRIDVDRVLKWVWLVNGVVLLLLLLVGGASMAVGWLASRGAEGDAVALEQAPREEESARPRAVRYEIPVRPRGTDVRMVLVRNGRAYTEQSGAGVDGSRYMTTVEGPVVNVAFLAADGSARLLVDRPAYFAEVLAPAGQDAGSEMVDDSLQRWITYEGALEDSNGDKRLDHRDQRTLYVSALDGTGFRRVLPAGYRVRARRALDTRTMLVTALEIPRGGRVTEEERFPQRAFVYDVPTGRLSPYAALDSLAARAGAILAQ